VLLRIRTAMEVGLVGAPADTSPKRTCRRYQDAQIRGHWVSWRFGRSTQSHPEGSSVSTTAPSASSAPVTRLGPNGQARTPVRKCSGNGAQGRIALSEPFAVELSTEFLADVGNVYQSRYTGSLDPSPSTTAARRAKGKAAGDYLFPELPDATATRPRSAAASQAFTRRGVGVGAWEGEQSEYDFHSFRRWFTTKAEQAAAAMDL
jgi:hypothetical protein